MCSSEPGRDHDTTSNEQHRPLLEVIALTHEDAINAQEGGADRLEIVSEISVGGLTPELDQFCLIRESVDIPMRVMLRTNAGFQISPGELATMRWQVTALRQAGADSFVFGFVDTRGRIDRLACQQVCDWIAPHPWTLHHAFDAAADPEEAWQVTAGLAGADCVLSGGLGGDLHQGLDNLCQCANWQTSQLRWLAGGGLILEYAPRLLEAGLQMFHIGRAARQRRSWDYPVSSAAVRRWRQFLDTDT